MKIAGSLYEAFGIPDGYAFPFKNGDRVLILGEVEYMPGHVVLVSADGKTHFGYHIEDFRKLNEEEV